MRPAGVHERIQQLRKRDEEHASAQPQQALRRTLTWLIHGCALLAYGDTGTSPVVETYRSALGLLDDPAQQRTGSVLEHASLDCLNQLQDDANLAHAAAGPQRHATRDEELARPALVHIPPRALVGHTNRHAPFRMACFNAAGSCLDGVVPPAQSHRVDYQRRLLRTCRRTRPAHCDAHPACSLRRRTRQPRHHR